MALYVAYSKATRGDIDVTINLVQARSTVTTIKTNEENSRWILSKHPNGSRTSGAGFSASPPGLSRQSDPV
jgi:hypothetical protein